jgi:septum formation protein
MLGFEFALEPTRVEEEPLDEKDPMLHARLQARRKAHAARGAHTQGTLIGADTIVVVDEQILGKPASPAEALGMLRRLQGRWHDVHTGVALEDVATGACIDGLETTAVRFAPHDDAFLEAYVRTGECTDKAGAYGIQGFGAMLVREIRGCFYNVMGFPVQRFLTLLHQLYDGESNHAR